MSPKAVATTLVGPGGAGKSTVGALVAERLGVAFVDLDQRLRARAGNISAYLDRVGYRAYARANVDVYGSLRHDERNPYVLALSSGFMTYPQDIHPEYPRLRHDIEHSPTTFVLIPSRDPDICAAETVRRQLERPFARSAEKEEAVIRARLPTYLGLRARAIETMGPLDAIVEEVVQAVRRAGQPISTAGR